MADNVILVGNSGSGKSTIAPILANFLGYGTIDTDDMIVRRQKQKITTLFIRYGEEYFRELEEQLLVELAGIRNCVIATGGWLPCYRDNWVKLGQLGKTVWIVVSCDELCRRFMRTKESLKKRPLLNTALDGDSEEKIQEKLLERLKNLDTARSEVFKKSDFVIDNNFSTPEFCALMIKRTIESIR